MEQQENISLEILKQMKVLQEMVCSLTATVENQDKVIQLQTKQISDLQTTLQPTVKFFAEKREITKPHKRLSKKEQEQKELDDHRDMLKRESIARLKQATVLS